MVVLCWRWSVDGGKDEIGYTADRRGAAITVYKDHPGNSWRILFQMNLLPTVRADELYHDYAVEANNSLHQTVQLPWLPIDKGSGDAVCETRPRVTM